MSELNAVVNTNPNYTTKTPSQQRLEVIPLIECCPVYIRDLVRDGVLEHSGHHPNAMTVATELIAMARYLDSIGEPYSGTPKSYYDDFVEASEIEPDSTTDGRFNSVQKKDVRKLLDDDKVQTCLDAWYGTKTPRSPQRTVNQGAKVKVALKPAPIPDCQIELAKSPSIPTDAPKPFKPTFIPETVQKIIPKDQLESVLETIFRYSETEWVSRYDWIGGKTFRAKRRDDTGKTSILTGDKIKDFSLYKQDEAIANAQGKWVLVVEGEKCVEAARKIGLVAVTIVGNSWSEVTIANHQNLLKKSNIAGVALLGDTDKTGQNKVKKWIDASAKSGLPVLSIDLLNLWPEAPDKADIVEWIEFNKSNGLTIDDMVERLNNAIATAQANQVGKADKQALATSSADRLKLDVQAYLAETNQFSKVQLRGKICSNYRIKSQDLDSLCKFLESQNTIPIKTEYTFDEFMAMGSEALDWIIPGFLPRAETILLAALAKVGKTLTAYDIAYAIISGGQVFGEQVNGKGKVLIVSSDESPNSSRRRLKARGFDLCPDTKDNLQIMTHLDLNDLSKLESKLDDFQPDLVIIDSLTSITRESGLSEKDAEFARPIYRIKDLLGRYGAAGILIHHENKNSESKGINKISGSARIAAAVWGIWQLVATNPDDDQSPVRWLKIKPREGEASTHTLQINQKELWASQGIFSYIGEFGDESGEKKTQGERVIELLKQYQGKGLTYREIDDHLNIGRSLYTALDRLESRKEITKRPSNNDPKIQVYAVPISNHGAENFVENVVDTPPPPVTSTDLLNNSQNLDSTRDRSHSTTCQQSFNNLSTTCQQNTYVEEVLNDQKPDSVSDSTGCQQIKQEKGGSVGVNNFSPDFMPDKNGHDQTLIWDDLIRQNDEQISVLEWDQERCKQFLFSRYGQKSRIKLSDEQLLDFIACLDKL